MSQPVVIVGGGPVGMLTALLLARGGVPSVILEAREAHDPEGSKAICFQRDVLDIFDRVGVAEEAVAEGVTWSVGRTYFGLHELFTVHLPDSGAGTLPPFINLSQSRLETLLRRQVERSSNVEVRYGHAVNAIDEREGVVTLSGEGWQTEARHVVACDGARSTVRRLLGIGFGGESFDDQFLICDIKADLPFPAERRFYFDPPWNPGRQVLVHQQPDGIWRIDWQVPPDFDLEAERASGALDERIRSITGEGEYQIDWLSVYRFHQRLASTFRAGGVFLAGDAAHLMSPFGARGLNSGAQDAENLAWKLAWVRRGWADERLLDTYEIERRAAAEENLRVTGQTMRFLVPQTDDDRARRQRVLQAAVTDEAAVAEVDSGKLATPFVYAGSPITTERTDGRTPVAGTLVGDAVLADGRGRLRQLIGPTGCVLTPATTPTTPQDRAATRPETPKAPIAHVGAAEAAEICGLEQGQVAVVRPDGHLAGVASSDAELARVTARISGFTPASDG